jgi:hypothetical protein
MPQIERRLRKLEENSRGNAAPDPDDNAVRRLKDDCIKRNSEMLFELWRTTRLAAGLSAEHQDYEDETAAEEAADEKAWNAHVASLSPDEREKLEKKSPLDRVCAQLIFKHSPSHE